MVVLGLVGRAFVNIKPLRASLALCREGHKTGIYDEQMQANNIKLLLKAVDSKA